MSDMVADHLAAYLLKVAKDYGERGVLRASSEDLLSHLLHLGDWAGDFQRFENAIAVLEECGLAKSSSDDFWSRFHRIDYPALAKFVAASNKQLNKAVDAAMTDDDRHFHIIDTSLADTLSRHKLLERYHDFGDDWLLKRLDSLKNEGQNLSKSEHEIVTKESFSSKFNEDLREKLIFEISIVERNLDKIEISNEDKSQVIGYIRAIKNLAETPVPPGDLIWELINRACAVAGIASFFVSIVALFK